MQEGVDLFMVPADADPPQDAVNELLGAAWRGAQRIDQQLQAAAPASAPHARGQGGAPQELARGAAGLTTVTAALGARAGTTWAEAYG